MRNDPTRLAELRRLMVLDSDVERDYDDITRLVATTLGVPIAIVNLLDAERDWFKSCVGIDLRESPVATSFCQAFFDTGEDLIVVADTMLDPRLAGHPLVVGPPHIRFYAAARLAVRGQTVGTLCAYDLQPRQVPVATMAQLQVLASAVVELLLRRQERAGAAVSA